MILNTLSCVAEGTAAFTPSDNSEMEYLRTSPAVTESNVLRDTDPPTPYRAQDARRVVLAVDDEPQIRNLLVRMLSPKRYSVTCVAGCKEAVGAALRIHPDIVLLDIHLEGKGEECDGFACISALRKSGYGNPIYMLSSDVSIDQANLAAALGADGYIVKHGSIDFWKKLESLIDDSVPGGASAYENLSPWMVSYLTTRGFSNKEVQLLDLLFGGCSREKEIACILDRQEQTVRKQFQRIRERLGAKSQADLREMLDGLSRFGETYMNKNNKR